MQPSNNDRQRRHREATSKAMKRAVWHCQRCGRGQIGGRLSLPAERLTIRTCRYCGHEHSTNY